MRRTPYAARTRSYNQIPATGLVVPFFRQLVAPGQSLAVSGVLDIQTPQLTQVFTNKAVYSAYMFYVPLRLIWDGFVGYATEKTGTVPQFTGAAWPYLFDRDPDGPALFRRAYKLVWNEYFADKRTDSPAPTINVTNDAQTILKPALALEGRLRELTPSAAMSEITFPAPVVASNAQIPLRQLGRALSLQRSDFGHGIAGNKYVDFLARLGVSADWLVQEAPEFLGTWSTEVEPSYTTVTSETDTGRPSTRYIGKIGVNLARKSFAEHGFVIGVALVRLAQMYQARPADVFGVSTPDRLWRDDQAHEVATGADIGFTGTEAFGLPPGWAFTAGQSLLGQFGTGSYTFGVAGAPLSLMYAQFSLQASTPLPGNDSFAMTWDGKISGQSPVSDAMLLGV